MKTPVKSSDPRKREIMEALKVKSVTGNKVTRVYELPDGSFEGHVMSGNRDGYTSLGTFNIRIVWDGEEYV